MTRLEEAAIRVHEILWNNTGETSDWPIRILTSNDIHAEFCAAIDELGDAVEEVKPGSKPWPI